MTETDAGINAGTDVDSDSRYKKSYRITAEELDALGARVKDPADRVERTCQGSS